MARAQPLFPLWPVALSIGIGAYFGAPVEPPTWILWGAIGLGGAGLVGLRHWVPFSVRWLGICLCLAVIGAGWAGLRSHWIAAPILDKRIFSEVSGRVVGLDRSGTDAPRITLDRASLPNRGANRTPARLRIALHGDDIRLPAPGDIVVLRAHLSPPPAPAEPGGFDFRRHAWFQQIGAVGYARDPLTVLSAGSGGGLYALRLALADAIAARLGPPAGGVAAAIVTGHRGHLTADVVETLRTANLSHLLAISGLHMGLLAASIFGLVRGGLALVPPLALRVPGKKIAAVLALLAASGYLALSGAGIATQRAFIMAAVMLGGVLLDRPALSLRSVAMAAMLVLLLQPNALWNVGFQMSFAATTALVAVFTLLRELGPDSRWARVPGPLRGAAALVVSSLVAGLATAPFAALAFHRLAPFGLWANLAAVPVMGSVVMPGALLAALGWPVGAEDVGLRVMDLGLRWILGVAGIVAGWPGAVIGVPAAGGAVLPILALAGLWLAVRTGRARLAALPALALGLAVWASTPRPVILVSESGGVVGVLGPTGRSLSRERADGFAARSWLAADGDRRGQRAAAQGWDEVAPYALRFETGLVQGSVLHLRGKTGVGHGPTLCGPGKIIVAARFARDPAGGCLWIDRRVLARRGALALMPDGRWIGARDGPHRIWMGGQ